MAKEFSNDHFLTEELENPYLSKFYDFLKQNPGKINKYSLPVQQYFLEKRFEKEIQAQNSLQETIIMDRSLMEYFEIFVVNLYQSKLMTEKDYEIYKELYLDMIMQTGHPQLVILLEASPDVLISRINNRNRSFEQLIDKQYLIDLDLQYSKLQKKLVNKMKGYVTLLRIDTENKTEEQVQEEASLQIRNFFE